MLTISAPIEIKAKTSYVKNPESFYRRIVGNYSLMETRIDEEDLLHISATPPEIYVAESDGMTSILTNNERNETNINKVDILNNVINRIVVSADTNLTYQDRVFITDTLFKLGIRDEKRFMNAFYRIAEETKNTNTLINLYLERGGELRELIEQIETRQTELVKRDEVSKERERENYLYSRVLDRLHTGEVYQIVSNYNHSTEENEINRNEYQLSNQSYTAQHILLSLLRERSGMQEGDLVFLNENTYEEDIENEQLGDTKVTNELTSAVLMDILKNIYHSGFDKFYTQNDVFYRFEDTFFGSSDQTFLRLMGGSDTYIESSEERTENYFAENNFVTESEIELLQNAPSGELTDEDVARLTETINTINVQNERRRREYVRLAEQVIETEKGAGDDEGTIKKTREDAMLALTDPEKLKERLRDREEKRLKRRSRILSQLQHVVPDRSMEIYQLLDQYFQGDTNIINNNIARPAEIGELIYDISAAEKGYSVESDIVRHTDAETEAFLESVKKARQEEKVPPRQSLGAPESIETIHRESQSFTEEDISEQLSEMETNLSKQINRTVESQTINENHVTHENIVRTNNVKETSLTSRDVEQIVENEVKSRMNSISNQVLTKLERQMKNEKMRRGY